MRSLGWMVVLLALGAAGWWWAQSQPHPESSVHVPAAPAAPIVVEPPQLQSAREPTRTTLAPMQLPGCSNLEAEPIGPSLADSANLLNGELWDRARGLMNDRRASPELREGLRSLARGDAERALPLLREAPDRVQDGFDLAAAGAFAQVIRALGGVGDVDGALEGLANVDRDGLAPMAEALVARQRGDDRTELEALTRAFRQRDDPAIAFALASTALRTGESALALEALDVYLESFGDDPWAVGMRPVVARRAELESSMRELEREGVRLRYAMSFERTAAVSVLDRVVGSLEDAARWLGEPRRPTLTVLLYENRRAYGEATCGPSWSGGLFDGSLRLNGQLLLSHLWVTVRHESLHAQLAHVAPRAPLWLHEGLAQHFQEHTPPELERTLALMARERTYVPFPSLEGSFVVIEDGQSARFAYHQSYAMVAAILEREGQGALRRVVTHLKGGGDPRETLEVMAQRPFTGDDLLAWIAARPD